jgi:hypothetical protein
MPAERLADGHCFAITCERAVGVPEICVVGVTLNVANLVVSGCEFLLQGGVTAAVSRQTVQILERAAHN